MTLQNFDETIQSMREIAKRYYEVAENVEEDEKAEFFEIASRLNKTAGTVNNDRNILFQ